MGFRLDRKQMISKFKRNLFREALGMQTFEIVAFSKLKRDFVAD